ncbi:hypothetical protein CBR_g19425 [Chara braunii]|uniref:Uncharacterized protein n=1 Tax=Chara braunii TaxID=69332 RepID=A0A388KXZ3_CHABU|nr:hypothetical protein CBR_g19425 [Chara braunii]|eukprot:GBG74911.1 hypothetical protein CBR_g19425 [Chara braunii]
MDEYPMYGLIVGFSLWGTLWRLLFPLGFWNTMTYRVEMRGGASTTPYTPEQEEEEEAARILAEHKARKEKKEVVKQAKKLALLQEQAAKKKKLEEELERLKEEEEKLKAEEKEEEEEKKVEEEVALIRRKEAAMLYVPREKQEAVIRELEAEEDPLKRQTIEEEKKLEWKLRLTKERKKRMEAASKVAKELEEVKQQRVQIEAQADLQGKMEVMARNIERLVQALEQQYQFGRSQDIALRSIRLGFREFAREMILHVGSEVQARLEGTKRFCTGAIEGAKLAAPREEEVRPRREPVKVKFPDSYCGKEEENFDNWEANVNSYVHLQTISPDEHVLIAFHALKDETASFAISLCRAAKCDNDMVAYSTITPLSEFFKLLRERFADVTRSLRASDKLQTIHFRQWRSAMALKGVMDELDVVPEHGVTETQLVNLFYRAIPKPLRGHFFEKSRESTMTYDTLSREVVAYEA